MAPSARRKLSRPRICAPFFRRDRLAASLAEGLDPARRLTLVTAGPGFGKTSAVADYLEGSGLPSAWIGLDPYDTDLVPFLTCMLDAIDPIAPQSGTEALALLQTAADPQRAIPAVCAAIAEALAERAPDGFVLVLDDFHAVESAAPICQAVASLIDALPETAQLILISRTTPPLRVGQLRARKHLVEIGPEQLRLSRDEIAALVEALSGRPPSSGDLDRLEQLTAGWAASVILAAQGRLQPAAPTEAGARPLTLELVFDFLAQEVFDEFPPQTREFVLATCLVPAIDAEFCVRHLGLADAGSHIDELVRRHLLSPRSRPDALEYHYHPVVLAFLHDRLSRHVPPERAAALRLLAGRALEPADPASALGLYVQAEAWPDVERTLARVGTDFVEQGRLDALLAILDALPPQRRQASPSALLYEGQIHRLWGQFDRALDALARVEQMPEASAALRGRAIAQQAACLGSRGDPATPEVAARALEMLPPDDAAGRALAHNILGLVLQTGDPASAQEHLEAALGEFERVGDPAGQAKVLHNLGLAFTRQGDFERAMAMYRQSLAQAERAGRHGSPATYNNLAIVRIYRGDLEQAWRDAAAGLDLAQRLGFRREEAWCLLTLSMAAKGQGDLSKAGSYAHEALAAATALQDRPLAAQATAALAEVALASGNPARALEQIESAIAMRQLPQGDPALADFQIPRGEILLALGRAREAAEILAAALSALEGSGLWFRLAQLHLGLSRVEGALGRSETRDRHLAEARAIGQAQGFDLPGAADDPAAPVVRPASEVDLDIRCLGEFCAFRSGEAIAARQWQGVKTKLVLAHLALHRQGVTRDQLGQALYGDEDVSRAAVLMLLSRLRQALEPELARNGSSSYVQFRDGRYFFNFGARYRIDTEDFDFHLAQAESAEGSDRIAHLERALALYRGRYLADLPGPHWVGATAEHFHARALTAFEDVTAHHLDGGDPEAALTWADRGLAIDPCAETLHQAKMRALARMGNRPGALRHYEAMALVLEKELGVAPDRASQALLRELQGR